MVFADFRPYTEGDDIRNIDWGIYLRLDRLILRLFEEEADLPVYLFLDASQSMEAGEATAARRRASSTTRGSSPGRSPTWRCSTMIVSTWRRSPMACARCCPRAAARTRRAQAFAFLEGIAAGGRTSLHGGAAPLLLRAAHPRAGGDRLRLPRSATAWRTPSPSCAGSATRWRCCT